MVAVLLCFLAQSGETREVWDSRTLQASLQSAKPGTTILLRPGVYTGGVFVQGVHGTKASPIIVRASDKNNMPVFSGGATALQLSLVSNIELRDFIVEKMSANGINIDNGGGSETVSKNIKLSGIQVRDIPPGNHDGIKLSGLDDFVVEDCLIERWGGSGIDMVGCHRGEIRNTKLRNGSDSGIQTKGGSSDIVITKCQFNNAGQRAVNIGGSTGFPYFRPSIEAMGNSRYEGKNIRVEGCTFVGGVAHIAFVGVETALVSNNTFVNPERWVVRILQETVGNGFVPCRNGSFMNNLIVFKSNWAAGGFNVGGNTDPSSFKFSGNWWFCSDQPARSRPSLPVAETGGQYGIDPLLRVGDGGTVSVAPSSPAKNIGAHSFK